MEITPDHVNGIFELGGAMVLWSNVRQIRIHKVVTGFDPKTTMFFSVWGLWNLFYYSNLDQWMSFYGGVAITMVNLIWLIHVYYYRRKARWQ